MFDKLNEYYERGYLIKQTHPTLPLTIWNYSQTTQYERFWDKITLMARGLVTDDMGNIVARPFDKFFNIEEGAHNVGTGEFEVFEKMDGSLGILFNYNGEWIFASRGSFISEQAIKFKELFESKYNKDILFDEFTYMFEIIYPENRIVVDYNGMEDVVMLGKRKTHCGTEWDIENYRDYGFNVVKRYDGIKDFRELKVMINDNQEGFIVHFNSTGSKCKVKGEEYIRLHKIMTEVSTTSIWNALANGGNMEDILVNVPDEFYDKIRNFERQLKSSVYNDKSWLEAELRDVYRKIGPCVDNKTFALHVSDLPYKNFLFALRNGKSIVNGLWKKHKPEYRKL